MTDYVITSGRSAVYPSTHYGGHFVGSRATFCLPQDIATFDANVAAIPGLPITSLTTSPVIAKSEFFGGHIKYLNNYYQAECAFDSVRTHDIADGKARWQHIEPSDNNWDFSALDDFVDAHTGKDILFTLFGTPAWASARPSEVGIYGAFNAGLQAEPSDMTKWDRFCTTIATRYLGKIKYYEVWNEPNYDNNGVTTTGPNFFFSGTFAKLSEMVRRANQAIKAVDPTAKIIAPAITNWATTGGGTAEAYFTGMLAASDGATGTMKDWVDVVGVHLYVGGNDITKLPKIIDRVNAGKTTAGVSAKETWDTESAPISPGVSGLTSNAAQLFITRSMIIQAAKGIARTFYYQYDNTTMGFMRTGIVNYRERTRDLLMSERIRAACIFTDGRVGYYTGTELITI